MQGKLIALEGIDGSGTTTQAMALGSALASRGHSMVVTNEPTSLTIGRTIRSLLHMGPQATSPDAIALMFAADRAQHVYVSILPALARGEVVIVDRYIVSTWVYQGMRSPLEWVRSLGRGCPWPDLTFVLSVDPDVGMDRIQKRAEKTGSHLDMFENLEIQREAAVGYDRFLAEQHPGAMAIDGNGTPGEVTARLLAACAEAGL